MRLMTQSVYSYSYDFLVFASVFYNTAPYACMFLRTSGNCLLPCYDTIRKITLSKSMSPLTEQHDSMFLCYVKEKVKILQPRDKTVVLPIDEIHVQQFFDDKDGSVVGAASNSKEAAKPTFAFVVSSILSKYKDVVHVLPTCTINGEQLFALIQRTIRGLEEAGFHVISDITDNTNINRKAMSSFAVPPKLSFVYPHPCDLSRPLFFLFDSVHIFKCIMNNWINQKSAGKCMMYPSLQEKVQSDNCEITRFELSSPVSIAQSSFNALKQLHQLEYDSTVRFAHNLSLKKLELSTFERQNVNLAVRICNDFVAQALVDHGRKRSILDCHDTSIYIKIISTWWDVVNVKTPMKGLHKINPYQQPLTKRDTEPRRFPNFVLKWLLAWEEIPGDCGKLSEETFTALWNTCYGLLSVADYCLSELGLNYVHLGKFQTDCLEARFGQYHQHPGGKYDIFLRQVFESEKKLRLLSTLKLKLREKDITSTNFELDWNDFVRVPNDSPEQLVLLCYLTIF